MDKIKGTIEQVRDGYIFISGQWVAYDYAEVQDGIYLEAGEDVVVGIEWISGVCAATTITELVELD